MVRCVSKSPLSIPSLASMLILAECEAALDSNVVCSYAQLQLFRRRLDVGEMLVY